MALAAFGFWVPAVFANVNSAIVAAGAKTAAEAGQLQQALDLYGVARDLAPSAPIYHLRLGQTLFAAGTRQADREEKIKLYEEAYGEVRLVLARNPLDHRAWSRAGEYRRELGLLNDEPADEAVHDTAVLAALMPGFWQSQSALAWSYVRLGRFEEGLAVVQVAKELSVSANASSGVHLLYYVEAAALNGLGRIEEGSSEGNRVCPSIRNARDPQRAGIEPARHFIRRRLEHLRDRLRRTQVAAQPN